MDKVKTASEEAALVLSAVKAAAERLGHVPQSGRASLTVVTTRKVLQALADETQTKISCGERIYERPSGGFARNTWISFEHAGAWINVHADEPVEIITAEGR